MKCPKCKDVISVPLEMVRLYIKSHQSRMNQSPEKFKPIGWICPSCQLMVYENDV